MQALSGGGGGTKADTRRLIEAGTMATGAEISRARQEQATKAARQCRDPIDAAGVASRADAMRARQYLRVWDKPDGMLHGNFELDPENGDYFTDFLLQITGPRTGGPRFAEKGEKERAQRIIDDPRSTDQIAAEALIEVIKVAAAADPGTLCGRIRPSVKLVVAEAPAPGQIVRTGFIEGTPDAVPMTTIDRRICNTGFTPPLFGQDGTVLDVGREKRLFSPAQRAALAPRDGGYMWPGCHRPPSYTEAHHLHGWDSGGLTNLDDASCSAPATTSDCTTTVGRSPVPVVTTG